MDPAALANDLTQHERRAIRVLSAAEDRFEPREAHASVGPAVLESLMLRGLVESGPANERYRLRGFAIGYRVTALGRKVLAAAPLQRR